MTGRILRFWARASVTGLLSPLWLPVLFLSRGWARYQAGEDLEEELAGVLRVGGLLLLAMLTAPVWVAGLLWWWAARRRSNDEKEQVLWTSLNSTRT